MSEITARKTAVDLAERLVQNVEQVVVGKDQEIRLVLAALVADSHVLPADSAADAIHLIGGTKRNGAVTVVRNGVASDVSTIR